MLAQLWAPGEWRIGRGSLRPPVRPSRDKTCRRLRRDDMKNAHPQRFNPGHFPGLGKVQRAPRSEQFLTSIQKLSINHRRMLKNTRRGAAAPFFRPEESCFGDHSPVTPKASRKASAYNLSGAVLRLRL
jgi:hypothetical protein